MVFCSSSISCAKRWPLALERLRFMSKLGRTPNTVCCNAAIGVCEKMSKWQQAIAMMRHMPLGRLANCIADDGNVLYIFSYIFEHITRITRH